MIIPQPLVVDDVKVVGINDVSMFSGLPFSAEPSWSADRIVKLGKAKPSSGHDCCLKGITVYHTINADHSFWMQWQRYHFHDIVSSQSKMHSLVDMELNFHPSTSDLVIKTSETLVWRYKKQLIGFEELVMSMPLGLMLKAYCVTNYLQLKTIHHQRRHHKMSSWQAYCNWIESLPMMNDILSKGD